ncbi:MAG: YwaF family protein [Lachnospiraceae bacterium]|nr:YwaF family protein [Lachnospiraceae bacterium]
MNWQFAQTPQVFGAVHLCLVAVILAVNAVLRRFIRRLSEKDALRRLLACGLIMIAAEIWKQWFIRAYVYPGVKSMWFFPWQLCSMAMYLSVLAPFLKEKFQNACLVFLCTYSLLAAVFALAVPSDMMRPQVWFLLHGFVYHSLMITEAMLAARILRGRPAARFLPATALFFALAAVAEAVNVYGHYAVEDISHQPNMFFITPYYPSTQVIFCDIAARFGIAAEVILYLALIVAGSALLWKVSRAFAGRGERPQGRPR